MAHMTTNLVDSFIELVSSQTVTSQQLSHNKTSSTTLLEPQNPSYRKAFMVTSVLVTLDNWQPSVRLLTTAKRSKIRGMMLPSCH